jgi:hypothetical protein
MAFVELAGGRGAVERYGLEVVFCRGLQAIDEFFEFRFHFFVSFVFDVYLDPITVASKPERAKYRRTTEPRDRLTKSWPRRLHSSSPASTCAAAAERAASETSEAATSTAATAPAAASETTGAPAAAAHAGRDQRRDPPATPATTRAAPT